MNLLKKLVPAPLLSCALVALWLILSRSPSLGQVFIGLALGLAMPLVTVRLRATPVRVRRPLVVVRFVLLVGYDVVVSNFQVAWGVLTWRWRRPAARFVVIPLDVRAPAALAALAIVTTVVPGTVWSELALDRSTLMLHVWDVDEEEEAYIARFKARYEAPLREIFE
ncbi:MAG: Na+/H+ antiporter subunit E [Labilithrix sp.]|nr:Na+/H+ antiporter subunit E [Labilithrix sp.]MCW5811516.1 Na+/H+ antiporter subunit E [Labilithrix sp.]